jgi:hypothetical protein
MSIYHCGAKAQHKKTALVKKLKGKQMETNQTVAMNLQRLMRYFHI